MEDRELIRRIQNGQTEYLNEIADRYYDDIYYFCCYQTGSREDSYDLAQETFLRFIKYVDRYQYRNLKGYLLTIAMNLCREYMRSNAAATRIYQAHQNYQVHHSCQAHQNYQAHQNHQTRQNYQAHRNYSGKEFTNCYPNPSDSIDNIKSPDSENHTTASENALLLAAALMKLPEIQREAVLLHHFYGYKNREIARMTGASYDAVKSRIRQGLNKLSNMLDPNDFK